MFFYADAVLLALGVCVDMFVFVTHGCVNVIALYSSTKIEVE